MTRLAAFLKPPIFLPKYIWQNDALPEKILLYTKQNITVESSPTMAQKLLLLTKLQCPECGFYLTLYFDIFC